MQNASQTPLVPRLAATVMLVRPEARGGFAVYLTRRSSRSRFMPDAFVFPGGAVDLADRELAANLGRPWESPGAAPELAVAALRELFEEAGILFARDARGMPVSAAEPEFAALREEFARGVGFAEFLASHALELDAGALIYYSNWITPEFEPIRFDAHFFIACAPHDQIAAADAVEVHDGVWLAPADALAAAERNEMTIRFPTRRHLERLARYETIGALLEHARDRTIVPIMPTVRADGSIEFDDAAW